jgi:hypothetical protein
VGSWTVLTTGTFSGIVDWDFYDDIGPTDQQRFYILDTPIVLTP